MADQGEQQAPQEIEKEKYLFKKVVFGHSLENFDRDQAITWLLALQAGTIGTTTPVEFHPYQPPDDLADESVLSIEGIRPSLTRADAPKKLKGINASKFTNNPVDDTPAAAEFYNRYQALMQKRDPEYFKKIQDLLNWLKAVEKGVSSSDQKFPKPKVLRPEDLNQFTGAFYAIKYAVFRDESVSDKQAEVMRRLKILFDDLMSGEGPPIADKYADTLTPFREKQRRDRVQLEENIVRKNGDKEELNPERLAVHTTRTGITVAYVNVNDIDTESGAFGVASNAIKRVKNVEPDIVVLVSTEKTGQAGESYTLIKIKIPRPKKDNPRLAHIDLRDLAERLNVLEATFGAGSQVLALTDFDGHKQVIGSPTVGTKLNPEHVYDAVIAYFDSKRYQKDEFTDAKKDGEQKKEVVFADEVRRLADKIDCGAYNIWLDTEPQNDWEIPERSVRFSVPSPDGYTKRVSIAESELPYYMSVMGEDVAANRAIMLEKTDVTEAREVVAARAEQAVRDMEFYLTQGDSVRVLSVLDGLNNASVRDLPVAFRMRALQCIAAQAEGIERVWDARSTRGRTVGQHLPDWIDGSPDQMQQARYQLSFLPRKIDTELIESLEADLFRAGDPEEVKQYIQTMLSIAISDAYKDSHMDLLFDKHLEHLLQLSLNDRVEPEVRKQIIATLRDHFGAEMSGVWYKLTRNEPALMRQITAAYAEDLQTLIPFIETENTVVDALPDIVGGYVIQADIEKVTQDLERQREAGFSPIANILVEISRPIQHIISRVGVSRYEQDEFGDWRLEKGINYAAVIKTTRFLRLNRKYQDELKVADVFVAQITSLAEKIPEVPIRVIRGGCPGILTTYITDRIPEALKDRVIFCDIDDTRTIYEDRWLRPTSTPLNVSDLK